MLNLFSTLSDANVNVTPEVLTADFAVSEIESLEFMSLEKIRSCTAQDSTLMKLKSAIIDGFASTQHATDPVIRGYFNGREHLWIDTGVIMFKQRIVIPTALRSQILKSLHCAHQGTKGMRARAANCVYWPGINSAIEQVRRNCSFCNNIAPSHPRQPLNPLPMSQYPFEYVCADAFTMRGHHCLVVIDKYTSWPIVFHFRRAITSRNIIESLRRIFCNYGTTHSPEIWHQSLLGQM